MIWGEFAVAATAAALLVTLTGVIPSLAAGARGLRLAAVSGVAGIAIIGVSGALASLIGLPFGAWLPPVLSALIGAVAFALRGSRGAAAAIGRGVRRTPAPAAVFIAAAVVVSAAIIGVMVLSGIGGPGRFSQTYDGVFHLSAVAHILQTGDASSFTLYRMTNPSDGIEFYPAAWHTTVAAVVQLTGASIPVAMNASWVVVVGGVWVTGCAFLADSLLLDRTHRATVVSVAALGASAFAAFPYLLLDWGTLYPTALAYSLLPVGVAAAHTLVSDVSARRPRRLHLATLGILVVWAVATTFSHPRSFATALLFMVPIIASGVPALSARVLARPGGRTRLVRLAAASATAVALVVAAGAAYVYVTYDVANRPISDHLNGGPATARQGFLESAGQALMQSAPLGPGETGLASSPALAVAVLVGTIVALVKPGRRWIALSVVAIVLLYSLAAGSNSDLAKLATGVWYKDKYRLLAALPVVAVPALALAVGALSEVLQRVWERRRGGRVVPRILTSAVAAASLVAGWTGPTLAGTRVSLGEVFALPPVKDGYLIDQDGAELLSRLGETVPTGQRVLGNPWDGSALSWVLGDREPVFPALTGAWDADRLLVAQRLADAATDPEVCAALNRLGVRYVFQSPGLLWNGDPAAAVFQGIDRAVAEGTLVPVDSEGRATLFEITVCE
ncbi:MAG: DUF6541 family protein [Naasia sp.]